MLSLNVFINDFPKISLVCCQVTRVRSVHNLKVFNFHLMLIATPSYSKFETIQLQREESAAKPNVSSKMFFILYVLRALARLSLLIQIACNLSSQ